MMKLFSHTLFFSYSSTTMSKEAVLTYFVDLRQLLNNEWWSCSHTLCLFRQLHSNEWGSCSHILCLLQTAPQQWMMMLFSHTLVISDITTAMNGEPVLTHFVYFRHYHSNELGSCSHIFCLFIQLHSNEWGSSSHILCLFHTSLQQWVRKLFWHTLFISGRSTPMS